MKDVKKKVFRPKVENGNPYNRKQTYNIVDDRADIEKCEWYKRKLHGIE